MGSYSKSISQRIKHVKIHEGYCLICGNFGKLSPDHVPPKGSITITRVEQRHVTEMMGLKASKFKGVESTNGSKFKTICHNCNNAHLGGNDGEVAKVTSELTKAISRYFSTPFAVNSIISVPMSTVRYARAMIGHILAATSIKECKEPLQESPYFDPLREFVLGNDEALNDSHDIYYWFYPHNRHVSAKFVGFRNNGHLACLSLLSFYPLAFMVTKKGEGTYPAHATKLELADKRLLIDLTSKGFEFSEFPFVELKGDQMMALSDYQAIISYPIGQ